MSEMPDFEPTVPPVVEYPKPKKPRKKPTRRAIPPRSTVLASPKKRKVAKRRGRPVGVPNKPKETVELPNLYAAFKRIQAVMAPFSRVEKQELLQTLGDIVKGEAGR